MSSLLSAFNALSASRVDIPCVAASKAKSNSNEPKSEASFVLQKGQDPEQFLKARMLKNCPTSALPKLLAREHKSLHDWIMENRPDLAAGTARHKRKKAKESKAATSSTVTKPLSETHDSDGSCDADEEASLSPTRPRKKLRTTRHSLLPDTVGMDESGKSRLDVLQKEKIQEVVEDVSGYLGPEPIWPVAGRNKKLFPPSGSLPIPVVRYLARNAGSVAAPSVVYLDGYEVGQLCFCHEWRKRVLRCSSYNEFIMLLRMLEDHLDIPVSRWIKCAAILIIPVSHTTHTSLFFLDAVHQEMCIPCKEVQCWNFAATITRNMFPSGFFQWEMQQSYYEGKAGHIYLGINRFT